MKIMKSLLLVVGAFVAMSAAQAAEVRLLCSNGMKTVVEQVQAGWEKSSGHKLVIEYSSAQTLKKEIAEGKAFDAAILTVDVANELAKDGKLAAGPKLIARGGVGIGVRKGAAKPDMKSPDGLKKFLLNAKSIAYTANGASRPAIDKMFEKMGIAAAVKSKLQLTGPSEAPERVAAGQAEVVLTLVSEILPIAGVELVGPLPAEHQGYVSFSAAMAAKPAQAGAAKQFLDYLASPAIVDVLKSKGLER